MRLTYLHITKNFKCLLHVHDFHVEVLIGGKETPRGYSSNVLQMLMHLDY